MDYISFRNQFVDYKVFNIHQILAWYPSFRRNNLTGWIKRGLLLRLRQGYYTFPECLKDAEFALFAANRIYNPSYVSTYTALAYHGMIPEAVYAVTSVSAMKTAAFENEAGRFSYRKIKPEFYFGFDRYNSGSGKLLIASPEKALLDILHLSPELTSYEDFEELRLDEDFMSESFDYPLFRSYAERFESHKLGARAKLLEEVYRD